MATVFLATDLRHDRKVAIKVMQPELAESLGGERFLREIRIAAQLSHPHIVGLLDSGQVGEGKDAYLYYVMPFMDGETLRAKVAREGPLPVRQATRYLSELADALIKANKMFDLLVIPGAGHTSGGPYGERKRNDFFVHHLMGVEPPARNAVAASTSTDGGRTWHEATLPHRANSTIWNFAVHAADPELVYASSVSGEVYRSTDAGASWTKLRREFGEVRALAWAP